MKKAPVLVGPHNSSNANWFHLTNYSKTNHSEYNYEAFKKLIEKQVLSNIQADLRTNQTSKVLMDKLFVQELNVTLTEKQFEEQILPRADELTFPLITYHSTTDITKINSILKHGYLVAGDLHPTKGYSIRMANGNIYGDGIYTSRDFDVIKWYSHWDNHQSIQVIVNLVFPKRIKKVNVCDWKHTPSLSTNQNIYYEYDKPGNYYEYDTLISSDGKIFVSACPLNVIPVAIITTGQVQPSALQSVDHPLLCRDKGIQYRQRINKDFKIPSFQLFGEYHFFDTSDYLKKMTIHPKQQDRINDLEIKHIFMIPPIVCTQTNLINQLNGFISSIPSSSTNSKIPAASIHKYCSFYNEHYHNIDTLNSFIGLAQQSTKGHAHNIPSEEDILSALTSLSHFLTNLKESTDYYQPPMQIIYLFINSPIHVEKLKEVLFQGKWKHYLSMQFLQFKIFFLNDSIHTEIINLKSCFDSIHTYQANYYYHIPLLATNSIKIPIAQGVGKGGGSHQVENNNSKRTLVTSTGLILSSYPTGYSLEDIFQVIYDELITLYETYDHSTFQYAVPYPLGVNGEGFIQNIQEQPIWDITSNNSGLIYKGYLDYLKINGEYFEIAHQTIRLLSLERFLQAWLILFLKFRNYIFNNPENIAGYLSLIQQFYQHIANLIENAPREDENKMKTEEEKEEGKEKGKSIKSRNPTKAEIALEKEYLEQNKDYEFLPLSTLKSYLYQFQKITSDIVIFGKLDLSTAWLEKLLHFKFQKRIIKRIKHDFQLSSSSLQLHFQHTYGFKPHEPSDVLEIIPTMNYLDEINAEKLGYRGYYLRILLSEAAKVEPWLLKIDYISLEKGNISTVYKAAMLEQKLKDSSGEIVTDILALPEIIYSSSSSSSTKVNEEGKEGQSVQQSSSDEAKFANFITRDDALRLYYGYAFTRVPYMFMSSQLFALPTITWTSALFQCYHMILLHLFKKVPYSTERFNGLMSLAYQLMPTLQQRATINQSILTDILTHEKIEDYLMESNNMPSIAKVIGVLTLPQAGKELIQSNDPTIQVKWHRLCFALLYEAILRSCKAYLRATNQVGIHAQLIREALQMNDFTNKDTYSCPLTDVIQFSNKTLLNKSLTNCSAYTVMVCLQFLELYHQGKTCEEICSSFHAMEQIPKTFLLSHLHSLKEIEQSTGQIVAPEPSFSATFLSQQEIPASAFIPVGPQQHHPHPVGGGGRKSQKIQSALFLMGMKYFKSKTRQDDKLSNHQHILSLIYYPEQFINELIYEQLHYLQMKQQLSNSLQQRAQQRFMKRFDKAIPYENYHGGMPKLFTVEEIEELNRSRPKDDQLMIKPILGSSSHLTGLLFHHCCFPNCPSFLKNLANEKDLASMKKHPQARQYWKNHGLNHHLQTTSQLLGLYLPNFHTTAKLFLSGGHHHGATGRTSITFDEFAHRMKEHYRDRFHNYKGDFQKALENTFDAYHNHHYH